MTKPLHISIPRAGYTGSWSDFVQDNSAFIPDKELTRLERALLATGSAVHVAHTNGEFHVSAVDVSA